MADCRRDGREACVADAARGCVHWMRETSVDDDGWEPAPLVRPKSPERRPYELTPEVLAICARIQSGLERR